VSRKYYIRTRGYSGDCLLWWKRGGCGYTTDLRNAAQLSEEDARRIISNRPEEDSMYPVDEVDAVAELHVCSERIGKLKARKHGK